MLKIQIFGMSRKTFKAVIPGLHWKGKTCKPAKGNDSRDGPLPVRNAIKCWVPCDNVNDGVGLTNNIVSMIKVMVMMVIVLWSCAPFKCSSKFASLSVLQWQSYEIMVLYFTYINEVLMVDPSKCSIPELFSVLQGPFYSIQAVYHQSCNLLVQIKYEYDSIIPATSFKSKSPNPLQVVPFAKGYSMIDRLVV